MSSEQLARLSKLSCLRRGPRGGLSGKGSTHPPLRQKLVQQDETPDQNEGGEEKIYATAEVLVLALQGGFHAGAIATRQLRRQRRARMQHHIGYGLGGVIPPEVFEIDEGQAPIGPAHGVVQSEIRRAQGALRSRQRLLEVYPGAIAPVPNRSMTAAAPGLIVPSRKLARSELFAATSPMRCRRSCSCRATICADKQEAEAAGSASAPGRPRSSCSATKKSARPSTSVGPASPA